MVDPSEHLAELQDLLATLLARLTALRNAAQAERTRAQQWIAKYQSTAPHRRDPNDLVIAEQAAAAAQAADAEAVQVEQSITTVRGQITQAERDVQRYNEALSNAAERGLTGDAAVEAAKNEVERTKTRKVVITVVVITAALALLGWLWYRMKRKKA